MKNSKKLIKIETGDQILFSKGENPFTVYLSDIRYALACSDDGLQYTIIDKKEKIVATTTLLFETHSDFRDEKIAKEMLKILHSGERELSLKYQDTFEEWDRYQKSIGSEVILKSV